ncbi:MAG TPA: hypothetical protein VGM39_19010 [Kofleriaceae bacterium]|jgi:hypothetical protein
MNAHEPDPADIWWNQARGIPAQKATDPYRSPSPAPQKARRVEPDFHVPIPFEVSAVARAKRRERYILRAIVMAVIGLLKIAIIAAR